MKKIEGFKIFYDKSNPVATCVFKKDDKKEEENAIKKQDERNEFMQSLYNDCVEKFAHIHSSNKERRNKIKEKCLTAVKERYTNFDDNEEYVSRKIFAWDCYNPFKRKLLFERKARFAKNKWNYFVTFTYDDKKFDNEEDFRIGLKKTLSNFATRRGWRYMICFERAPLTDRLHAHGLLIVPEGQMVGEIKSKTDYNFKSERRVEIMCNSFFQDKFGRNDFEEIELKSFRNGGCASYIDYILKYIIKSGEKVFYSRHLASFVIKELSPEAICCAYEYQNSLAAVITKYVLYDEWEAIEPPIGDQSYGDIFIARI